MRALVLRTDTFGVEKVARPGDPPGTSGPYTRVKVLCCALNHRDQYIREGLYARVQLPAIMGSDVCGMAGEDRVVIDATFNWGNNETSQGRDFHIMGMPSSGGFAEEVVVPTTNVYQAPSHLTDEQVAALPIAGVTAFRALFVQGACTRADTVVITGIGGGVATMAMLLAQKVGCKVIATSRSQEKLDSVAEYVTAGVRIDEEGAWVKELKAHRPTLIIDSIGGDLANGLLDAVAPAGRIIFYGASKGVVPGLNLHRVFWKQVSLVGSTMGSPADFANMLAFVEEHKITPIVDRVYSLDDAVDAFDRMKNAEQLGKIVVRI